MTKEEIVMLFINTVKEFAPEKLEEYIEEIKKNSRS
ncbi:NADH dehydrogenase [Bacillus cereus]|nr:NADH dehydrogenase [Bacillus cereus]OJD52824.1 NADH dehydrogenase [Bacillus sp. L27]